MKWPSRGWNWQSNVYFAWCMCVFVFVRQVLLFLFFSSPLLSFIFMAMLRRYIPYVMSVWFQQVATIRCMLCKKEATSQQKQTRSRSALHIHQKNAKLSTLNHHKLLCFKYYFVSLKVFFIRLFSFLSLFSPLTLSNKSNFPVQFKQPLTREMKKKYSMAKSLTPHIHTHKPKHKLTDLCA